MKLTNKGFYTTCSSGKEFEIHQWVDQNGNCKSKAVIPENQLDSRKNEVSYLDRPFDDLRSLYDYLESLTV